MKSPRLGDTVLYALKEDDCRDLGFFRAPGTLCAAIVTHVIDSPLHVALTVLPPAPAFFCRSWVTHSETGEPGTWQWPEER